MSSLRRRPPSLRRRPGAAVASVSARSDRLLACCMLVQADEVAERHRDRDVAGAERVEAELVLELGHEHGDAEGVEAGFEQRQLVGEGCEALALLVGYVGDLTRIAARIVVSVVDILGSPWTRSGRTS